MLRRDSHTGFLPSPPDQNDFLYVPAPRGELPPSVDLRKTGLLGAPWSQKRIGSCQSHAAGRAFRYVLGLEGEKQIMPSRLFIYYNARAYAGLINQDAGAYIRDTFKGLAEFGAPPEKFWPYVTTKWKAKPPADAYRRAEKRVALEYMQVAQDPDGFNIKSCLAEGIPVVVGFSWYEGTNVPNKQNGWFQNVPKPGDKVIGSHAVLVVGYTTVRGKPAWIIEDSDGDRDNGGFWYMGLEYLNNPAFSTDFWCLRKVGHQPVDVSSLSTS